MHEINKKLNFWSLERNVQLILTWLCIRLRQDDRVAISISTIRKHLSLKETITDDEIRQMLNDALKCANYLQLVQDGESECEYIQLAPSWKSFAEPPLLEILNGEVSSFEVNSDNPLYLQEQKIDPLLPRTRLEEIIAQATKRIKEERKKRRSFIIHKTKILSVYNPYNYLLACRWTREGKVVLWPNEVTYGLTTNGLIDDSVQAIYDAKGRVANPIPILTCKGWVTHFGYIPRLAQDVIDAFWPDNISIVVPKRDEIVSNLLTAGMNSVALMCPNRRAERLAFDICKGGGEIIPIACTSANISGQKPIVDAGSAIEKFYGAVDVILTGPESSIGVNTTILDFSSEPYTLLRVGPVSLEEIYIVVPELKGKVLDCTKNR